MADIESNININVDTSGAVAAIKNLQGQISAFQISMSRGDASAQKAARTMQQNLIDNISATGKFNASLANIKSTTESFTDSLERNKFTMGEYFRFAGGASKTFGRTFKREFDVVTQVATERVKDLQTQYISLGRDANGALKAIKVRPLSLDMKDFGVQTQMAAQRAQLFNQLIKQGSTNLLNWGKNTQWAGRQLMVGFTVPLTMMGTLAAKTFMEIEQQVVKLKRVYGDFATSIEDTDRMVKSIRSLAGEFTKWGVSVEKTMELAAEAAATGSMGAALIDQVTEATRLAVLGNVEQAQALETTMSITNAFGVATQDLAQKIDFLNAVENQSVTSIEDLTIAVPKAGPVVKQLGGDVEDLAFFLTAMKEGGINASEGANALKSGLAALINPTGKAVEFLEQFNISINGIVNANKGDVKGLIVDFAKALDDLDPLDRARSIEQLFGKFQFSRISTLFQNVIREGSQAERVLSLTQSSAAELAVLSERELKKVESTTTFKFQKSVQDFQAALAPIGEEFLKAITPIIKFATDILKSFNNMSAGAKQFITTLTLIVGGVGPALLMTIGLVANGVANIIKFFNMLRNVFFGTSDATTDIASQTEYMTQAQIEAAAVASSLDQAHNRLVQTFGVEGQALETLLGIYERAIVAQNKFRGATGSFGGNQVQDISTGYAKGVVSVPGPKGAGDIIPAMLSPGEAVIPAKQTEKYKPLIKGMIAGNLPGYNSGGIIGEAQGVMSEYIDKPQTLHTGMGANRRPLLDEYIRSEKMMIPKGTKISRAANEEDWKILNTLQVGDTRILDRFMSVTDSGDPVLQELVAGESDSGGRHRSGYPLINFHLVSDIPGIYDMNALLDKPMTTIKEGLVARGSSFRVANVSKNPDGTMVYDFEIGAGIEAEEGFNNKYYNDYWAKIHEEAKKESAAQGKEFTGRQQKFSMEEFSRFAAGGIVGYSDGGILEEGKVRLGKTIKTREEYEAPAQAAYEAYLRSSLANQEPEPYVRQHSVSGGHSFSPFGVGGIYTKADGTQVFVKPVVDEKSAVAEVRGTQIARDAHNLISPQQRMVVMADPTDVTGVRRFLALESPLDERLIAGESQNFDKGQYFKQLVASLLRGDKDLSADNLFGDVLADVGPAGVFSKASGVRDYADMPSMESQAMVNLLGIKGGAKRAFAESTSDIARSLTPQEYDAGVKAEIQRVLPQLKSTIASMGLSAEEQPVYDQMIARLEAGLSTDWGQFQGIHSNVQKPVAKFAEGGIAGQKIPAEAYDFDDTLIDFGEYLKTSREANKSLPWKDRVKWWSDEELRGAINVAQPMPRVIEQLLRSQQAGKQIIVLTARPSSADGITREHLAALGIDPTNVKIVSRDKSNPEMAALKAPELKGKLAAELINDYEIEAFYDDLFENREAVSKLGIPSFDPLLMNAGGVVADKMAGYANGVVSVPGPKGAGDIIPAMLSPGEAVIPAKQTEKYKPLIQGMIAGNLPGFMNGTDGVGKNSKRKNTGIKTFNQPNVIGTNLKDEMVHGYRCTICDAQHYEMPPGGYCDQTQNCLNPEELIPDSWIADETDRAKGYAGKSKVGAKTFERPQIIGTNLKDEMVHGYRCTACGMEHYEMPSWGYCDETAECTDPETLVPHSWIADETDRAKGYAGKSKGGIMPGYAKGVLSVPGPKGAGDVVPAMLSPGEAVIPAKQTEKYKPLIQGMIAGNIPGFMAGTDGGGNNRRKNTSREVITDLQSGEYGQEIVNQTGVLSDAMQSLNIAEGTQRKLLSDYRFAVKQGGEVLVDYVERLMRALRTYEELGLKASSVLTDITRKGYDPRTGEYDAAVAEKAIKINPAIDQSKPQFAHGDVGVTKPKEEALAYVGLDEENMRTRAAGAQRQLGEARNIAIKSGFGRSTSGKRNRQMDSGEDGGALISDLFADWDEEGVKGWATSVEIGNGNLEELTGGLTEFDVILKNIMQTMSDQTGITKFVDSMEQVQELGGNALPMDIAYEAALAEFGQVGTDSAQATYEVLNRARNTITELRADGGVGTGLMRRRSGGIPNLDTTQFISDRLESEAYTLGQTLATQGEEAFINGLKDALEISSPSEVTKEVGKDTAQGFVDGAESKVPDAKEAGKKVSEAVRPDLSPQVEQEAFAIDNLVSQGAITPQEAGKLNNSEIQRIMDNQQRVDAQRLMDTQQQDSPEAKRQRGRAGAYKVARGAGMVGTVASMAGSFLPGDLGKAAQSAVGPITAATTAMSMIPGPWGIVAGALAASVSVFMEVQAALAEIRTEASGLVTALGTSSSSIEKFAIASGNVTAGEQMSKMREIASTGYAIQPGKNEFAASFMEGEDGQQMVKDVEASITKLGRTDTIQNLGAQLSTAVISGALSEKQAQAISYQLGKELGDMGLTIGVSAQIKELIGTDGEKFKNNQVEVAGEMTGNAAEQLAGINAEMQAIKATGAAQIFKGNELAALEGRAAGALVNLVSLQQQIVDSLDVQYMKRIENLKAQGKMNEAAALMEEHESKRSELLTQNKGQLEETLGLDFDVLGTTETSDIQNTLKPFSDFYESPVGQFLRGTTGLFGGAGQVQALDMMSDAVQGGQATNVTEEVSQEITARVKTQYAGTEDEERVNNLLDNVFNKETAFDIMVKLGLASGQMDLDTVDLFQQLDFGKDKVQAYEIVASVSGTLGGPAGQQLMQLANLIPPGETAAQTRFDMMAMVKGNMSDPIYGQQILDTLTTLGNYSGIGSMDITAVIETFTTDPGKLEEFMSQMAKVKDLQESGELNAQSIISQKIITNPTAAAQFANNQDYFNSLDPVQQVLYIQTYLTVFDTISDGDATAYKNTNNLTGSLEEVKAIMAAETAEDITAVAGSISDVGDAADDAADSVGGFADEFDALTAEIDMYNKALRVIEMLEDDINKKYDERSDALQKVAELNAEIAQQQEDQLDLADALSRGDIAAAARAAQKLRANNAALAIKKQEEALEAARKQELSQVEFAGFDRSELEARLKDLEMQLAQRDYSEAKDYFDTKGKNQGGGGGGGGKKPKKTVTDPVDPSIAGTAGAGVATDEEARNRQRDAFIKRETGGGFAYEGYEKVSGGRGGLMYRDPETGDTVTAAAYNEKFKQFEQDTKNATLAFQNSWTGAMRTVERGGAITKANLDLISPSFGKVAEGLAKQLDANINLSENQDELSQQLIDMGYDVKDGAAFIETAGGKVRVPLQQLGDYLEQLRTNARNATNPITTAAQSLWDLQNSQGKSQGPRPKTLLAMGGLVKPVVYKAAGGYVSSMGSDSVPALLTPGEFVIKRPAVQSFGVDNLQTINSGGTPDGGGVYNYSINVNVATDANPEQIARAVAENVRRTESYRLRGNKI